MRKFSSYGPVDTTLHYYVPRQVLIEEALIQLVGENPDKGGHYLTVWAPRQQGKTWVMVQTLQRLRQEKQFARFDTVVLSFEHLKMEPDVKRVVQFIVRQIARYLGLEAMRTEVKLDQLYDVFEQGYLKKPLILIFDEFDALAEEAISGIVGVFRNIHISRRYEADKPTQEKTYLLHGVALIGVRSVLGIENQSGSPFNVQRSLHIPNLTLAEVEQMYQWYERESGQQVEPAVIERVYQETQGQPGLVSWLGELLTESYNQHQPVITSRDFARAYSAAIDALPNANIQNIISKAKREPYQAKVLEMFQTDEKLSFHYDDPETNFLYTNGVVEQEVVLNAAGDEEKRYLKFPCPLVQKRLFNYFSAVLFRHVGKLHEPFEDLDDIITEHDLNIKNLLRLYERYLRQNKDWLLRDVPRRVTDLRVYEAVYHFNLYMYLSKFLQRRDGQIYPEFPTGNGKIDLLINYVGQRYGLEVKSYTDQTGYTKAINQAAQYGQQLNLSRISLIFFIEAIDKANREKYEKIVRDAETQVRVEVIFVAYSPT